MSTIAAGTTTNTALVNTGDTSGTLQLQVNGTTPALTLATTGAVGVGSTPGYGTSGQVLTSAGSGAAPTWSTVSSVPTFTATGSISAAGVSVALNSDGTVSAISGTTTAFSAGSSVTLPSSRSGSYTCAAYDSVNQKIVAVISYSSYLMGYVGTISGTTITWGSEFQIVSVSANSPSIAYDTTNNKFVVVYCTSGALKAKTLTVSGTSLSAGAELVPTNGSGYVDTTSIAYSPFLGKFLISAYDSSNVRSGLWLVTISGTSLTENVASVSLLTNYQTYSIVCSPVTGIFALGASGTSLAPNRFGYIYPITATASSIAVGTSVQISSSTTNYVNPTFFGSVTSGYGIAIVYDASGPNIKAGYELAGSFIFGGGVYLGSSYSVSRPFAIAWNPAGANIVVAWSDGNTNSARSATATVSKTGTTVLGAVNTILASVDSGVPPSLVYYTAGSNMFWLGASSVGSVYRAEMFTPDGYSTNAQSFIGFSTASAANGATVGVSMYANMNANQSGLTLGSKYYLTYTGSVSTTDTGFPYAGQSYGTTKIFVGV